MKVLHVMYTTLPDVTGGSIRSHDILRSQNACGIHAAAISGPFQPPCRRGDDKEIVDDIEYMRTFSGALDEVAGEERTSIFIQLRKLGRIRSFSRMVTEAARDAAADIVHAHSSFFCGYAALRAADVLGIPVVYEVRSLWEERRRGRGIADRVSAWAIRKAETAIMRRADRVVVINEGLRSEVIGRGINAERVETIGNAVDLALGSLDTIEGGSFGWQRPRFGYIGNLSAFEGLFELLEAWCTVEMNRPGIELHFFGGGKDEAELKRHAVKLGLKSVQFHGRFERAEVMAVYNSVDVVVIPRRKNHLSETVTPIKPLEALLFGKLVMVSPVAGLTELIQPEVTGLVLSGFSPEAIAEGILGVLNMSPEDLEQIVKQGNRWVRRERTWEQNAVKYKGLYAQLIR